MSVCALVGGQTIVYATSVFTLIWTHSVEKTHWEEDWRATSRGLEIVEARIAGSGAGMEPPSDAVLAAGVWHYHPALPPQHELVLARSGATGGVWRLCYEGACHDLPEQRGEASPPVILRSCPGQRP
jgi:hypothetical protein